MGTSCDILPQKLLESLKRLFKRTHISDDEYPDDGANAYGLDDDQTVTTEVKNFTEQQHHPPKA
ncbi:hypothetical protein CHS0354_008239 [Potamilus streckersoni]|uniref:Uncharacterized protein n=1 Tax=Potamilus streckersoni TaxID=2493646 RepID=A0AAE0T7N3_9BIVA|nr:hypothetical protein CHS0354_008239 [Potamilus streckersoni]